METLKNTNVKNVNSNVKNLTSKEAKNAFIKQRKNEIKNDLDLSKIDFDKLNKVTDKIKNSVIGKRDFMYKFELLNIEKSEQKKFRTKIRKQRNALINSFLKSVSEKNTEIIKKNFNLFKDFYLKNYVTNDFQIESICSKNSDKETTELVSLFLDTSKKLNLI